ncbi:glycosyltransferase [Flavobacterium sp.]|uniref:glycosyltransferase n=1 Tax=Flavobacterium sp. TaxID=239 RepID=UPI00374DB002
MKKKKLVIISHTEHYTNENGIIMGWGSTINEVNFLADYWDEVCHVACLYDTKMPLSSLPYSKNNITFVPIPPFGGKSLLDKVLIFTKIPKIISQVVKSLDGASEVQLRLPTSMGLFLLPLFSFFINRKFTLWIKYAGNWGQENPPISYKIQRWFLKKNWANCKVTINGFWENQPKYCLSFENPCLTLDDIEKGKIISKVKRFDNPFVFTFVGRLESAKGVDRIIEALQYIPLDKIAIVNFIGDGEKTIFYKEKTAFLKGKIQYHGFLDKVNVHKILSESHFLLLPSDSEGFPKVIAEAACYGVVPIVSNVGSIGHYVNDTNGFVWNLDAEESYGAIVYKAISTNHLQLKEQSNKIQELAKKFTFINYLKKLNDLVFIS